MAGEIPTYDLVLKGQVFSPAELKVKAGEGFRIRMKNDGDTPVELESHDLRFEKYAVGHSTITVNIKPQKPGSYKFYDDFHPDEVVGLVTVE